MSSVICGNPPTPNGGKKYKSTRLGGDAYGLENWRTDTNAPMVPALAPPLMITALFVAKHRTELAIFLLGAATLSSKECILT